MFCNKCGAGLRETDCFCSRCGAPVEGFKPVGEYLGETRREPEGIYYDESLYRDDKKAYRDSFLDRREERSHAVLVTISVLLIIILMAAVFLVGFFFFKKRNPSGIQSEISIHSDEGQEQIAGDGDIVILNPEGDAGEGGDPAAGNDGSGNGSGAGGSVTSNQTGTGSDASAGQTGEGEGSGDGTASDQANAAQNAQGQPSTEKASENSREVSLDMAHISQIFREESGASKAEVYVYDLMRNQEYRTEGSDQPMYASALVCVPILYTAAVKLDQGEITLNDQITYVNSIGGRGEAYPEEKDGKAFPLSYYLTAMTSYSDNNCVNCLIDYLGLDGINGTCRAAGFASVELQRKIVAEVTDGKDNYVSAKDLAGMVREMYSGKFRNISREFMNRYFRIDAGDGYRTVIGLAPDLPSDITFLNHNGRGDTRYNEVAVISGENCSYIISVMTGGDYGFSYEEAIEDISNYVYQSLGGTADE